MRKSTALVAPLALALVFGAGVGLSQRQAEAKDSFTVVERASSDSDIDLGEAGASVGDVSTFRNDVFDEENANQIGWDSGSCTVVEVGKWWQCSWTVTFDDGGSIAVQGPLADNGDDTTLAVLGGTGKYSGAEGEMVLHTDDGGDTYKFIFTLD